ncbi:MAG TPA: carbamoyltransferase HypF [Candidatus Saccharimonadales bacterium]|nr:carbamoyltransferase HypF [Candidatus Saccharimonadales bacterium]
MATADQSVMGTAESHGPEARLKMTIRGAVQGVGFRPFVYRLAADLELNGWVNNTAHGVFVEVEGPRERLDRFLLRVEREKPTISFIQSLESSFADPVGYEGFEIRKSEGGEKTALVLPDIATCPECLREIFEPGNRRFGYPFTNCTNCGPRYTIIESLPYDRPRTTMKKFTMCAECEREYGDPENRRFHAQPNACPECGPQLQLWSITGAVLARREFALKEAAEAVRQGKIVGVKGLGGFHLMADARNEETVRRLRERKHREEKPFALMYPAVEDVLLDCELTAMEERMLRSPESPIVLVRRRKDVVSTLAPSIAPGNPMLGVMVAYTPMHHLLMRALGFAVIATSANLSDEPICTDELEAVERLGGIADLLLIHNRPILRHVDDSIVRVMAGREMVMRRARGFAPLPVRLAEEMPTLLGVGAHQKNTVALSVGRQVFISQHIGDLETAQASVAFERVVESLKELYEVQPETVACDLHPNYISTEYANRVCGGPVRVQHHYAHVLACMAENEVQAPALGVAWDGSGWGPDGTVWGGEFLKIDEYGYTRATRLRPFRLAGSERAVREPRRCGLALLYEAQGEEMFEREELNPVGAFSTTERRIVAKMLRQGLNSPWTSSAGRLFDAVASLIGVRQVSRYEGQAAMELEWLAAQSTDDAVYEFHLIESANPGAASELDWAPMVCGLLADLARNAKQQTMAKKFHNTLAEMIARVAGEHAGMPVVLSGGCFQNRLLTELTVARLETDGVKVYWHQRIPPNDGGIALGQVVAAARGIRFQKSTKERICV